MFGLRALMTNKISFMAMLSSLQLWLSCAVLDYNLVIMSCYIYHLTAFQNTCSLRILSLMLLGHELEEEDKKKKAAPRRTDKAREMCSVARCTCPSRGCLLTCSVGLCLP